VFVKSELDPVEHLRDQFLVVRVLSKLLFVELEVWVVLLDYLDFDLYLFWFDILK